MNFRRSHRFAALVLLLLPLTASPTVASTLLQGRVVAVHDGDTLTVLDRYRREYRIRLHLIDAPEKNQDYGSRSKQSLSQLVYKRDVSVEVTTVDRYHRLVGKVLWGGYDINLEQVARGMAWVYRRYGKDERYLAAEAAARRARLGLWAKARPVPPWEFRKDERDDGHWYDPRQWFRR
ncbi:thermonuclease family protein [Methylolobus aquaticus]